VVLNLSFAVPAAVLVELLGNDTAVFADIVVFFKVAIYLALFNI
jgi:hypothetical protein